jgi:hypothetical protein
MMRRFVVVPVLLCLAAVLAAPAAQARPGEQVMFEAPGQLGQPDTLIPELQSLGVTALRVNLRWVDVAPDRDGRDRPSADLANPSSYDWSKYQGMIDAAHAKGWKLTISLAGPVPRWATEGARDHITKPRASDFKNFATAAGKQFGSKVSTWTIWNEPNFPTFLQPQFVKKKAASPAIYRALYVAGQSGLKKAVKNPRVLIGETAPRAGAKGVAPLAFLRGMLCLNAKYKKTKKCAKLTASGYAHHPYAPPAGPTFVPTKPDDVTIGSLSRLTKALDKAGRAKAITSRLKVYLTEFGVQSYPDKSAGVPLSTQSDFRSASEKIAWKNSRVYGFSQYLMKDDATAVGTSAAERYPGFQSGLQLAGGKVKPAYEGFRLPLVATVASSTSTKVALWGLVRPATGKTKVVVQYATKGKAWKKLKTVTTKSDKSFSLNVRNAKKRVWRVQWKTGSVTYSGSSTTARKG